MEQKTLDKVKNIINNEKVQNTFYNLFDRWEDESRYEDLNEYGKCIMNTIHKNVPDSGATLISTTCDPFGIKFNVDSIGFHLYVKVSRGYLVLSCKLDK